MRIASVAVGLALLLVAVIAPASSTPPGAAGQETQRDEKAKSGERKRTKEGDRRPGHGHGGRSGARSKDGRSRNERVEKASPSTGF